MTHMTNRMRAEAAALLTAILCVALLGPHPASAQDVFTVSGISVDGAGRDHVRSAGGGVPVRPECSGPRTSVNV